MYVRVCECVCVCVCEYVCVCESVPLRLNSNTPADTLEDLMDHAVGLLTLKLQRLHQRTVESLAGKHSVQKLERKLEREGKDVRLGDRAQALVDAAKLTVTDPTSGSESVFNVRCVCVCVCVSVCVCVCV